MTQPSKYWIEQQVVTLAEMYPHVWWVQMYSNSCQQEYTSRILVDIDGITHEVRVTDKQGNYHLMVQELEDRLNEVCYE